MDTNVSSTFKKKIQQYELVEWSLQLEGYIYFEISPLL